LLRGCKNRKKSVEKCRSEDEKLAARQNIFDGRASAAERRPWEDVAARKGKKKALCGNRRPSNDCLPYEKSSKNRCCCVAELYTPRCLIAASGHKDNDQEILLKELNDTKTLNC
jgi:hypothetical protein